MATKPVYTQTKVIPKTDAGNLDTSIQKLPQVPLHMIAADLYERGFNVIPIKPKSKEPFILRPFFYSRLHLCDPGCKHSRTAGKFESIFREGFNLGVMTGRTSGNLVAIDCDDLQSSTDVSKELTARGLPFWSYTTHRGQGFLLRLEDGEAVNLPECNVPKAQVWGHTHYVVLPPSRHPEGDPDYTWVTPEPFYQLQPGQGIPAIRSGELSWLGIATHYRRLPIKLYGLPEWTKVLSDKNRQTLAHGTTKPGRNTALTAAAYDMAANEIDEGEAEDLLLKAAGYCKPSYPIRDTEAILRSAYRRDDLEPAKKTRDPYNENCEAATNFGKTYDWRATFGRKANSRKRMFFAMIERAKVDGRDTFRASGRELADMLAVNYGSRIRAAISDLVKHGLIKRINKKDRITDANIYSFGDKVPKTLYQNDPTTLQGLVNGVFLIYQGIPTDDRPKDVFKRLGFASYLIWVNLKHEPMRNVYQISKRLNLAYSTTKTAVYRLQTHGLIEYSEAEGLWTGRSVLQGELSLLADLLGSSGTAAKIRSKHRVERELRTNEVANEAIKGWTNRLPLEV